jgi:hypothetical protein
MTNVMKGRCLMQSIHIAFALSFLLGHICGQSTNIVPNDGATITCFAGLVKSVILGEGSTIGEVNSAVGIPRNSQLSCVQTSSVGCKQYNLTFSPSPDQAGRQYSVCIVWNQQSVCVTLNVQSPQPVFYQPVGSWYYGGRIYQSSDPKIYSFRANIGCLMSIPLKIGDRSVNSTYQMVLKPLVDSSSPPSTTGLPRPVVDGSGEAKLEHVDSIAGGQELFEFRWRPARGQESTLHYTVCFEATDSLGIASTAPVSASGRLAERSVCFRILVEKCQYCVQPGESFVTIASQYKTDWLHIYTANPTVLDPDKIVPYTRINTGVFYKIRKVRMSA